MCTRACVIVYALRTEDALNIRCTLKPAVASIGSVYMRGSITRHSHREGVKDWDSDCQNCLYTYTYLSTLIQIGLRMNTLESPPPTSFFRSSLFVFHKIYSTLSCSICHFLKCHSFFFLLFLLSSSCLLLTWFVCFAQYPHVFSHLHSVLHAVTFHPSLHNADLPLPSIHPATPTQNCQMASCNELERWWERL